MRQDPTAPSFSVLGPMRAWRDGTELDLGPPQQRATLAVLLVRVKRPVPVGEIADVLWGQGQPVSATNVIHRHIGMLRRVLEPELPNRTEGQRLVRVSGGYRLRVDADDVDLTRFRRLRERAQEAARTGDAAEAVERFNDAFALWRGRSPPESRPSREPTAFSPPSTTSTWRPSARPRTRPCATAWRTASSRRSNAAPPVIPSTRGSTRNWRWRSPPPATRPKPSTCATAPGPGSPRNWASPRAPNCVPRTSVCSAAT